MKYSRLLVVVLFGFGAGSAICEAPDSVELKRLLDEFLAGASVNDLDAHRKFWADDLIYTSSTGERFDKADILERNEASDDSEMSDEPVPVYTAEDVRIQQYGDTAIVAFRLIATSPGAEQALNFYNTGTFLRRDGLWQVIAWQATRIPDPE